MLIHIPHLLIPRLGYSVGQSLNLHIFLFFISFVISVHHAEPPGLPLSLHPGGPEVWGGGVLQDLHLPAGLPPGGEGPLLPPRFPPGSSRSPGCLDALQSCRV